MKKTSRKSQNTSVSRRVSNKKSKTLQSVKKASIKDTATKVIEAIKKPFKPKEQSIDSKQKNDNNKTVPYVDVPFAEINSNSSLSRFFCINDIDIGAFDYWQLYEHILKKHPGLSAEQSNESIKRNAIIDLLNDVDLMQQILKDYNMTVLDFFKFLFRLCPSIFKGLFVRKIQKTLKNKPYAKDIRFGSYHGRKTTKKRCSIF